MGLTSKNGSAQLEEVLETEGQRHLQTLVKKQLNTDISLQQQFAQHKTFTEAGEYAPEIRSLSGITPLSDYKSVGSRDCYIEELKQCGLTEDEIDLKLSIGSHGNDHERINKSKYGANPQVQEERLQKVELKISENKNKLSKPDTFSGVVNLGRHTMELERSLININKETRTISNALTREGSHIIGDPNDPINHLPDILRDVQKKAKLENRRSKKRHHSPYCHETGVSEEQTEIGERQSEFIGPLQHVYDNKHISAIHSEINPSDDTESDSQIMYNRNSVSQTNNRYTTVCSEQDNLTKELDTNVNKVSGDDTTCACSQTKDEVDSDDGPRKLKSEVEFIPEEVIKKYSLTNDEIRNIPRFKNFCCGNPSNVLYLKNLSSMVTEEDLVSLFGRYQKTNSDTIIYKLMTGRMRGQAFITFSDTATSTCALQLVNGYHFKGKPIIIQYGKKQ